jgi:hypothetical protein
MDICNKSANHALRDLPINTWVKLHPASYRYDGTREAADRFPMMQFARAVFVPEYGSILSWGGGGHGASRIGNDVWMYDTARNEWRQMTPGDPLSSYPNPGLATPLFGDWCHNDSSFAFHGRRAHPRPTFHGSRVERALERPDSGSAPGIPTTAASSSTDRTHHGEMADPIACPPRARPLPMIRTFAPEVHQQRATPYHQGGTMAFDPIGRKSSP